MGLVVEDQNIATTIEVMQHAACKGISTFLAFLNDSVRGTALRMLGFGSESMPVRHHDPSRRQQWSELCGNDVKLAVIALLGVAIRAEHLQALLHRKIGARN